MSPKMSSEVSYKTKAAHPRNHFHSVSSTEFNLFRLENLQSKEGLSIAQRKRMITQRRMIAQRRRTIAQRKMRLLFILLPIASPAFFLIPNPLSSTPLSHIPYPCSPTPLQLSPLSPAPSLPAEKKKTTKRKK